MARAGNILAIDTAMREVVEQTVSQITRNVRLVAGRIQLEKQPVTLIAIGGIITKHRALEKMVRQQLATPLPYLQLKCATEPPVTGAVKLAQLEQQSTPNRLLTDYLNFLRNK